MLITGIFFLFFAGFLLGEDALGGGIRMDLYLFHGPTIFALRDGRWLDVLPNYTSATTPLFHIVESIHPFLGHDLLFRGSNLLVGIATAALFAFTLSRRFAGVQDSCAAASLIAASFLLSPYFRAETYWVSTDILPILLLVLCGLLLLPLQDEVPGQASTIGYAGIVLLTLLGWAAFYCRQTYLFLPAYAFGLLMLHCKRQRPFTLLLSVLAVLPAIWLFAQWRGFNPPAFQRHAKLSAQGIVAPLSMVFTYALPFIADALRCQRDRIRREWQRIRSLVPWAAAGLLLFLVGFRNYRFDRENAGGGVASKLLSGFGTPGAVAFLLCSYLGLLIVLWVMWRSRNRTRGFIALFLLPTFTMSIVYQRYYDPVLVVLFFLFTDKRLVRPFRTARMGYTLIAFNALLLVSAFASNARSKPVFWPVTSPAHPWTGTPLDGKVR